MIPRRTIIGLLLLQGSAIPSIWASESASPQERFLAEYPTASKRLEDYYKHVKIYLIKIDKFRGEMVDYEFSRNGDSIRLVELDGKGQKPYNAYVVDHDVIFKLKQDTTTSPYSVMDLGKGSPADQKAWANLVLSKASLALAPYGAYLPGSIRDLLSEKALRIKSVQQSQDRTILVDWEGIEPGLPRSRGSFAFLPDSCWALRDYTIIYTGRRNKRSKQAMADLGLYGSVEYKGSDDGIPIIYRLQTWTSEASEKVPDVLYEVKDFNHEVVPKDQFTLESFGIGTRPAPPQVPIMYYLLALSAISALAVLALRYIRNRS